ncbi:unnamed protein product [Pedinophyceae sp. YPF-701]|nr:unnamed protein product [Pedinophyceae sp. YPF-701]
MARGRAKPPERTAPSSDESEGHVTDADPPTPSDVSSAPFLDDAEQHEATQEASSDPADSWQLGDLVLLVAVAAYASQIPLTKVEESFNTQAVHDILYHGRDLASYDHNEFPGVVPRSFLGAFAVAAAAKPLLALFDWVDGMAGAEGPQERTSAMAVCRLVLALMCVYAFSRLRAACERRLGKGAGTALCVLTALQFHLPFYMSRMLPNVMALPLVLSGLADWIDAAPYRAIVQLSVAALVLRCDLLILCACVGVHMLATRAVTLLRAARTAAVSAVAAVGWSVLVDSVMWRRWLWPEGGVLFFNTVMDGSKDYGVMPWHWYFTSALPRALLLTLPLVPVGLVIEKRVRSYFSVGLAYVALYSLLGHKEVRFLFPAIPLLTLPAACCAAKLTALEAPRHASFLGRLAAFAGRRLLFVAYAVASACALYVFASAAQLNYPGGLALRTLHSIGCATKDGVEVTTGGGWRCSVHISAPMAETGVSRFLEIPDGPWTYSKAEDIALEDLHAQDFTYLVTHERHAPGYDVLGAINGFERVRVQFPCGRSLGGAVHCLKDRTLPVSVELETAPKAYIHLRQGYNKHHVLEHGIPRAREEDAAPGELSVGEAGNGGKMGGAGRLNEDATREFLRTKGVDADAWERERSYAEADGVPPPAGMKSWEDFADLPGLERFPALYEEARRYQEEARDKRRKEEGARGKGGKRKGRRRKKKSKQGGERAEL